MTRNQEPGALAPCTRAASRSDSCTWPTLPNSTREAGGSAVAM